MKRKPAQKTNMRQIYVRSGGVEKTLPISSVDEELREAIIALWKNTDEVGRGRIMAALEKGKPLRVQTGPDGEIFTLLEGAEAGRDNDADAHVAEEEAAAVLLIRRRAAAQEKTMLEMYRKQKGDGAE